MKFSALSCSVFILSIIKSLPAPSLVSDLLNSCSFFTGSHPENQQKCILVHIHSLCNVFVRNMILGACRVMKLRRVTSKQFYLLHSKLQFIDYFLSVYGYIFVVVEGS